MATADKNDPNTSALEAGETVKGSVTGLTDAPSTSGGSSGGSTPSTPSTPSTTTKKSTTTTPATTPATTAPSKAEPPASATNVAVNPAYVHAMEVGYLGETPTPEAQRTTLYPAHGDGDLSTGSNTAARPLAAKTDAPDATAEASSLDPSNDQQWGNGPDTKD